MKGKIDESNPSMPSNNQFLPSLLIHEVNSGSPAEKAGLKSGHKIWKLKGRKVFEISYADFINEVVSVTGPYLKMSIERYHYIVFIYLQIY